MPGEPGSGQDAPPHFRLRPWRAGDEESLVRHADDPAVAANLRDAFPHPYTRQHAAEWIQHCRGQNPVLAFAIEVGGEAAGGVGLTLRSDVYTGTAELGFWLGRQHWGRGIATAAVRQVISYAFTELQLRRLEAAAFEGNSTSLVLLQRVGFQAEGRARGAAVKGGQVLDEVRFGLLREEWAAALRGGAVSSGEGG